MFVRIIPYLHAHTSCTNCTSFYSHWSAIKRQVFWGPGFLNLGTTSGESRGTPGGQKSPLKSRENRMVNHKSMGFLSDFQRKKQQTWWISMETMVFSKKTNELAYLFSHSETMVEVGMLWWNMLFCGEYNSGVEHERGWEYPILAPTRFVKLWCAPRAHTMGVSQRKNKEHTIL